GVNRFVHGVGCAGTGHVDDTGIRAGGLHRAFHGVEHGDAVYPFAAFTRADAAHHFRAIFQHQLGLKASFASGDTLYDHRCVFVDVNRNYCSPFFAASSVMRAALVRDDAPLRLGISELLTSSIPSCAFLPTTLITSRTFGLISS